MLQLLYSPIIACPAGHCQRGHAKLMLDWALFWERKNSFLSPVSHWEKCPPWGINYHVLLVASPDFCRHLRGEPEAPRSGQACAQPWCSLSIRWPCISVWSSGNSNSSRWAQWHTSSCFSHSDWKRRMCESRVVIKWNWYSPFLSWEEKHANPILQASGQMQFPRILTKQARVHLLQFVPEL